MDKLDYARFATRSHRFALCYRNDRTKYENQYPNESIAFLLQFAFDYLIDFARLHRHLFAGPDSAHHRPGISAWHYSCPAIAWSRASAATLCKATRRGTDCPGSAGIRVTSQLPLNSDPDCWVN